jgi:hypothetical protein
MTLTYSHGETLLALCRQAHDEMFFAAPFIKEPILRKILAVVPESTKVTIVTRWKPEEVLRGVSDLEVLDLVASRPNTFLLLHPCLHAKYYRGDGRCLIGSANLTATALGWSKVPNIEILLEVPTDQKDLRLLEETLLTRSIPATPSIKQAIANAVEELKLKSPAEPFGSNIVEENGSSIWLPTCTSPDYLFKAYSGGDTSSLLNSVVEAANNDLISMGVMPGLDEAQFQKYVAAILEQIEVVEEIVTLSRASGITSHQAAAIVAKTMQTIVNPLYDANTYWLALKNWLLYFFPERFRVRAAVEVFEQAREI